MLSLHYTYFYTISVTHLDIINLAKHNEEVETVVDRRERNTKGRKDKGVEKKRRRNRDDRKVRNTTEEK